MKNDVINVLLDAMFMHYKQRQLLECHTAKVQFSDTVELLNKSLNLVTISQIKIIVIVLHCTYI